MSDRHKEISSSNVPVAKGLTQRDFEHYYELLGEEIADYDCGTLCAPLNNGVPICCSTKYAVPLLYRAELSYLQEKGDLWFPWNPKNRKAKKLMASARRDELYCECRGPSLCIREQRSIACRTFPLEPYIDEKGVFIGLTFMEEFAADENEKSDKHCPLSRRPGDIREEYLNGAFAFWKAFLRIPAEYETYRDSSRTLRRRAARTGESVVVLYPVER